MNDKEKTKEQVIEELEELWQTNEFFSLLLESTPFAVYTCEVGGDFGATYVSKNITALTGYKPEDFISNSSFWFNNVHPDDKKIVNTNLAILLEKGFVKYDYRWKVSDASYKWFNDVCKVIKLSSSQISYILGTWIDITERKNTEKELREKLEELEKFYEMAIDRELRMKELKEEIKTLKSKLS